VHAADDRLGEARLAGLQPGAVEDVEIDAVSRLFCERTTLIQPFLRISPIMPASFISASCSTTQRSIRGSMAFVARARLALEEWRQ
jgi:hypothetical protein